MLFLVRIYPFFNVHQGFWQIYFPTIFRYYPTGVSSLVLWVEVSINFLCGILPPGNYVLHMIMTRQVVHNNQVYLFLDIIQPGYPRWFRGLRFLLTSGAVFSLLATLYCIKNLGKSWMKIKYIKKQWISGSRPFQNSQFYLKEILDLILFVLWDAKEIEKETNLLLDIF